MLPLLARLATGLATGLLLAPLIACSDPASAGSPGSAGQPAATGTDAEPLAPSAAEESALAIEPQQPAMPAMPEGPIALVVSVEHQWIELQRGGVPDRGWPVSTSAYGVGSAAGSNRTPLGRHRISEVFGAGAALGTIFEARSDTGRLATITTDDTDTDADHVTTRVLWLEGLEPGVNQGPGVDSKQRYIYIHGTPEEGLIGRPASHGCIRMKNVDVVELFELVGVGTPVTIVE